MTADPTKPSMSQRIFNMGLPKETISAYLLCCGLTDAQTPITVPVLLEVWNADEDLLHRSLQELTEKKIIKAIMSDGLTPVVYQLEDVTFWEASP